MLGDVCSQDKYIFFIKYLILLYKIERTDELTIGLA